MIQYDKFGQWINELNSGGVFKRKPVNVYLSNQIVVVKYGESNHAIPLQGKSFSQACELLRDMITDLYYNYEWDGKPIKQTTLQRLLGYEKSAMSKYLTKIGNDIKSIAISSNYI